MVPWAGRLGVINYGPHLPRGSSDTRSELTPDLRIVTQPESVGGTLAARRTTASRSNSCSALTESLESLTVPPGPAGHRSILPKKVQARWVRLTADRACRANGWFSLR